MSSDTSLSLPFLHTDKHEVFTNARFWRKQRALKLGLPSPDEEKTVFINLQISCNHGK